MMTFGRWVGAAASHAGGSARGHCVERLRGGRGSAQEQRQCIGALRELVASAIRGVLFVSSTVTDGE